MIVTFYSFKGGVGRSMALANVAWLLFRGGFRVTVVDCDLEAPGVDAFLADACARAGIFASERPSGTTPDDAAKRLRRKWNGRPGLVDFLVSYRGVLDAIAESAEPDPRVFKDSARRPSARKVLDTYFAPEAGLAPCSLGECLGTVVRNSRGGCIRLLSAGRRADGAEALDDEGARVAKVIKGLDLHSLHEALLRPKYAERFSLLNWEALYRDYALLDAFNWLRSILLATSDFVLVDSRTGVTESGGSALIDLADLCILLSAPNTQNRDGIKDIAKQIWEAGKIEEQRRRPRLWVSVPARLDPNASGGGSESAKQRHDILKITREVMEAAINKGCVEARFGFDGDSEREFVRRELRSWMAVATREHSSGHRVRPKSLRYVAKYSMGERLASQDLETNAVVGGASREAEEEATSNEVIPAIECHRLVLGYSALADLTIRAKEHLDRLARPKMFESAPPDANTLLDRDGPASLPTSPPSASETPVERLLWLHTADADTHLVELLATVLQAYSGDSRYQLVRSLEEAVDVVARRGLNGGLFCWTAPGPVSGTNPCVAVPIVTLNYRRQYTAWDPLHALCPDGTPPLTEAEGEVLPDRLVLLRLDDDAALEPSARDQHLTAVNWNKPPTPLVFSLQDLSTNAQRLVRSLLDPTGVQAASAGTVTSPATAEKEFKANERRLEQMHDWNHQADDWYSQIRAQLDWANTTGSAKKWWQAFEDENKARKRLVARLAIELLRRQATITEFFLSYVYSNTDNIHANLHYLDYSRLKREEQRRKKKDQQQGHGSA